MPKIITTILLEETNYSWVLTGLDARISLHLQFEFKYKVLQMNPTGNSEKTRSPDRAYITVLFKALVCD